MSVSNLSYIFNVTTLSPREGDNFSHVLNKAGAAETQNFRLKFSGNTPVWRARNDLRAAYSDYKANNYSANHSVNVNTLQTLHNKAEKAFDDLQALGGIREKDAKRFENIHNTLTLYFGKD